MIRLFYVLSFNIKVIISEAQRLYSPILTASVAHLKHTIRALGTAMVARQAFATGLAVAAIVHVVTALADTAGGNAVTGHREGFGTHWHCVRVETVGTFAVIGAELAVHQCAEADDKPAVHPENT